MSAVSPAKRSCNHEHGNSCERYCCGKRCVRGGNRCASCTVCIGCGRNVRQLRSAVALMGEEKKRLLRNDGRSERAGGAHICHVFTRVSSPEYGCPVLHIGIHHPSGGLDLCRPGTRAVPHGADGCVANIQGRPPPCRVERPPFDIQAKRILPPAKIRGAVDKKHVACRMVPYRVDGDVRFRGGQRGRGKRGR